MSVTVMPDGSQCRPNISRSGVRRRYQFGAIGAAITVALAVGMAVARVRWFWCLIVFVPAAGAAVSLLQAVRKTCVARAAEGTFEHEDFSKTPAAEDDAIRSREVAAKISRDSMIIGVVAVALTMLAASRLR
jgi:hypothetical protein